MYKVDKGLTLGYHHNMNYTTVTLKEARDNLSELIERAALTKETFLVTKFGKKKAFIISVDILNNSRKARINILKNTFGIWAKRKDMVNSWVDNLRKQENKRHGQIFT